MVRRRRGFTAVFINSIYWLFCCRWQHAKKEGRNIRLLPGILDPWQLTRYDVRHLSNCPSSTSFGSEPSGNSCSFEVMQMWVTVGKVIPAQKEMQEASSLFGVLPFDACLGTLMEMVSF
jgi:hypothetical protein